MLGERYQLGPDAADGTQVLRRTGRTRFNPMPVWLLPVQRMVRGEYEVRGEAGALHEPGQRECRGEEYEKRRDDRQRRQGGGADRDVEDGE